MKIDWAKKLTSRKLWVAVAGLVSGLILAFKGDSATAEVVGGCIMSVASVISYIVGEGLVDAYTITNESDGE
jgi:NO-binding membrane sensor protein with MHYT domain